MPNKLFILNNILLPIIKLTVYRSKNLGNIMNKKIIFTIIALFSILPFTANAQYSPNGIYAVLEAGTVQNKVALSGDLAGLAKTENSSGSFGAAIGYRALVSNNLIFGGELNIASTNASNTVNDGVSVRAYEGDLISGLYLTGGVLLSRETNAMIYALIGVSSTKGDSTLENLGTGNIQSIEESGEGFSFGAAVEFGLTDNFGVRAKMIHTKYNEGDSADLRISDTSIMGGLVIKF